MRAHCILWLYLLVGCTLLRGSNQEDPEEVGNTEQTSGEAGIQEPGEVTEEVGKTEEPSGEAGIQEPGEVPGNEEEDVGKKTKCEENEILTEGKGCVDRDALIESVLLRTWVDENLDYAKTKAGIGEEDNCKEGEILTALGCAVKKKSSHDADANRVPVVPSHLVGKSIVNGEIPILDSSEPRQDDDHRSYRSSSRKKVDDDGEPIFGKLRPRKYVFLPGRRLQRGKHRCRANEVLGRRRRCLRKRGKKGIYRYHDPHSGQKHSSKHNVVSARTKRGSRH